jgi:hypothetical protein
VIALAIIIWGATLVVFPPIGWGMLFGAALVMAFTGSDTRG